MQVGRDQVAAERILLQSALSDATSKVTQLQAATQDLQVCASQAGSNMCAVAPDCFTALGSRGLWRCSAIEKYYATHASSA